MVPQRVLEPAKRVAQHVPFPIVESVRFPHESLWMRFGIKRPGADQPSVVLFTLHKVASTFTNRLLDHLNAEHLGLRRLDWDKYVYNRFPRDSSGYIAQRTDRLFASSGYCYGVFREALPIADLGRYRVLLILRDPRDILTSHYFSEAHSHALPVNKARRREFEARRARVRGQSIDDYVLEQSLPLVKKFDDYVAMCRSHAIDPVTYEQMMGDWDDFVDRVGDTLGIDVGRAERDALRSAGQIGVEHGGDVTHHRRRGTPGDHREQLRRATVATLTRRFSRHLDWLELSDNRTADIDLRTIQARTAA